MTLWAMFVDFLQYVLFVISQVYGGNIGLAVITLSLLIRLMLLSLTLKLSRRSVKHQALMNKLKPGIERLKSKYKDRPEKLNKEIFALFKRHNARPVDFRSILGVLVQAPVILGLFTAIKRGIGAGKRFLWISDLAKPDFLLVVIAGVLTYISAAVSPGLSAQNKILYVLFPAILTVFFLWRMAAGVSLYWTTFSIVGIFEKILLRYSLKKYPV